MTATVYIVTVTDNADFQRVIGHSVWSTYDGAAKWAEETVAAEMERNPSDLGDTYDRDICQMQVRS